MTTEIPYGYCHCGCGGKTTICRDTDKSRGMVKGTPNRFIAGHQCRTDAKKRFWAKVDKKSENECWPWLAAVRRTDEGYGAFWLGGRHQPASRVAWMLTFGDIPEGLQALHKCDNPPCCNPNHLFLGTNLANNADKVAKDRHIRGDRSKLAKLTEQQVISIKKIRPDIGNRAHRAKEVAAHYNVKPGTIIDIWSRSWKYLNHHLPQQKPTITSNTTLT